MKTAEALSGPHGLACMEAALRAARWNAVNCNCYRTPRTEGCPIWSQKTLHWGLEKVVFQTGLHLCFWRSFHISMSHTSDTQWHITSQKPNVPRSRISHPENLESTLSDLVSAGTLTLYSFHEPLAISHPFLPSTPNPAYEVSSALAIQSS